MPPKLFIHIGAHKTGTTSIQRACWKDRSTLAEHGVLYPESNIYHFGHHRLAFALKKKRDPAKGDIPDLNQEIMALRKAIDQNPQDRILISSEAFFVSPPDGLTCLRDGLDGIETEIIAFVRRQDDYLLSFYNHSARKIGNNFTRPLRTHVANPRGISREISFLHWLQRWQRVFGSNAVHLRRYEDCDPLKALLNTIELSGDLITSAKRANPSAPGAVVEAVRFAKRIGFSCSAQKAVRDRAKRVFANWPARRLSSTKRKLILDAFAEENSEMFKSFGMENTYQAIGKNRL